MLKQRFCNMQVRALCHATESVERVERAVRNLVGERELSISSTKGHHGNEITLVETTVQDQAGIAEVLAALGTRDLRELVETLDARLDESNNLFFRVDKQASYAGTARLSTDEDVISVRVHVNAYPAKREVAMAVAVEYIRELIGGATVDAASSIH
jgi:RNA binding exosome subunit